jgi:hypothetical protein
MKPGFKYFVVGLLIGLLFLSVFVFIKGNKKKDIPLANEPLSNLYWLVGDWKSMDEDGNVVLEHWSINSHNELEGYGLHLNSNDTILREQLSIKNIHGALCYVVTLEKGGPILFTLTKRQGDVWTFRNSRHDFPQRIIYSKQHAKRYKVKTEGRLITGLMDGEDFTFVAE